MTVKVSREKEYIKSPIHYMGGKYRLLAQLLPLLKQDKKFFIDVFGGSGTVLLNVGNQVKIYNDLDPNIVHLFKLFQMCSADTILQHIENKINQYNLPKTLEEMHEGQKYNFMRFRDDYNKNKNDLDLLTLHYFAINSLIRFNSEGKYNAPSGCYSKKPSKYFKDNDRTAIRQTCEFLHQNQVHIRNCDFRILLNSVINKNNSPTDTFLYLDPPYSNTTAVYNEKAGWNIQDDIDLFLLLDKLNELGYTWALSNVFACKGVKNNHLIEWSKKYVVHHLNINYNAFRGDKSDNEEVLITNYTIKEADNNEK